MNKEIKLPTIQEIAKERKQEMCPHNVAVHCPDLYAYKHYIVCVECEKAVEITSEMVKNIPDDGILRRKVNEKNTGRTI